MKLESTPGSASKEIRADISNEAISSGIGERMFEKIVLENSISNHPIPEGKTVSDCKFELEIDEENHVSIVIQHPSTKSSELIYQSFGVGQIAEDKTITFNPSFGAYGDEELSEEQKDIVRTLVSQHH